MSIKSLFNREKTTRYDSDDYRVNTSRRSIIVIAVLSLLLAIVIWALAVYADSATYNFTSVPIEIRNSSAITDAGYQVVLGTETVSFRATGRTRVVKIMNDDSVKAYVDLKDVNVGDARVVVKLRLESEYKLMYTNISIEEIPVLIIDKLDETK